MRTTLDFTVYCLFAYQLRQCLDGSRNCFPSVPAKHSLTSPFIPFQTSQCKRPAITTECVMASEQPTANAEGANEADLTEVEI
jgi:hypothetical protein